MPNLRYALVLPILACSPGDRSPDSSWPYAVAGADCAPWDGAAISVTLAGAVSSNGEPGYPLIRLSVYHPQDEVLGHTFSFSEKDTQEGGGSYCQAEGACVAATEVWIRFERLAADTTIAGQYRFTAADGHRENGSFKARFAGRGAMCG